MKKAVVLSMLLLSTPAAAMTGAEYVQAPKAVAVGYAVGIFDYETVVGSGNEDMKRIMKLRSCFASAKLSNDTFYSTIVAHIQNNPENLANPAVGAVLQVINKICP